VLTITAFKAAFDAKALNCTELLNHNCFFLSVFNKNKHTAPV